LGAVAKAGTSTLEDVLEYSQRIRKPGFAFMNTPGYDPVSITGLAAGGVNLIAFTTGRGSAIGFPSIPVLKIASNSNTYRRMTGNMDINAGRIADGDASVEQVGREIFETLLRVASGTRTHAEELGTMNSRPGASDPYCKPLFGRDVKEIRGHHCAHDNHQSADKFRRHLARG